MLLAMLLIYPLLRKYKDQFFYIICPFAFVMMMGYSYQNYLNLRLPSAWNGWILKGLFRAIMETFGGCLCYIVAEKMKTIAWTKLSKILLSILRALCFWSVIVASYNHGGSKFDWNFVILFMIGITITVSQCSYDKVVFRSSIFNWLGTYSFSLYLGHGYWGRVLKNILPETWTYREMLPVYLLVSAVTGLIIMYVSKGLKNWWKHANAKVKRVFVVQ